jgi:hypothetical protein
MPVKHLLKQLEHYRSKRNNRDVRPAWVTQFVNEAAELFEPLDEVGRVGFECQIADDCWEVALYLGSLELVGGREDGENRYSSFHFDVHGLIKQFDEIDQMQFAAYPEGSGDGECASCGLVTIEGRLDENRLRVRVFSIPPADMGPGLRRHADGRCDTV